MLTVKNTVWDGGFAERVSALEADGSIERLEETEPYVSMPGETGTVPSRALVIGKPRESARLAADPRIRRIDQRLQMQLRRDRFHRHDEFVGALGEERVRHAVGVADIAVADRQADGVAIATAGQIADGFAIAQDGLTAEKNDTRILGGKAHQPLPERRPRSALRRRAAEEIDVARQFYRPAEPGLEGRVVRRDVRAPGAIALLETQGFKRTIANGRMPSASPACIRASKISPIDPIGACSSQPSSPT